ncbi:MAG: hypothetical protein R6T92_08600 [Desulfosalsimonadaceae bacterium]
MFFRRKQAASRRGDVTHTLFPRQWCEVPVKLNNWNDAGIGLAACSGKNRPEPFFLLQNLQK